MLVGMFPASALAEGEDQSAPSETTKVEEIGTEPVPASEDPAQDESAADAPLPPPPAVLSERLTSEEPSPEPASLPELSLHAFSEITGSTR